MAVRYLKTVLVGFVALLCLGYAGNNLVNLQAAYTFVEAVVTLQGHEAYPSSFLPAITVPVLIWSVLAVIICAELAAGVVAARGAWDMWRARTASAAVFDDAKRMAVLGCGLAVVVWFGLFAVFGGAFFQMWQTELGANSLEGSFQNAAQAGIILVFVAMNEEGRSQ